MAAGEAGRVLARQADPNSAERSDWPKAAPTSFSAGEGIRFLEKAHLSCSPGSCGSAKLRFQPVQRDELEVAAQGSFASGPRDEGSRARVATGFLFQVFILACTDCCCFYCRCV